MTNINVKLKFSFGSPCGICCILNRNTNIKVKDIVVDKATNFKRLWKGFFF